MLRSFLLVVLCFKLFWINCFVNSFVIKTKWWMELNLIEVALFALCTDMWLKGIIQNSRKYLKKQGVDDIFC